MRQQTPAAERVYLSQTRLNRNGTKKIKKWKDGGENRVESVLIDPKTILCLGSLSRCRWMMVQHMWVRSAHFVATVSSQLSVQFYFKQRLFTEGWWNIWLNASFSLFSKNRSVSASAVIYILWYGYFLGPFHTSISISEKPKVGRALIPACARTVRPTCFRTMTHSL